MSQDTFNDKEVAENIAENTEHSLFTFEACSDDNFGIKTAEEGWFNFTSDKSPIDKESMKQRLGSLRNNISKMKGEVIGLKLIEVNGKERFIDYTTSPDGDESFPPIDSFDAKNVEEKSDDGSDIVKSEERLTKKECIKRLTEVASSFSFDSEIIKSSEPFIVKGSMRIFTDDSEINIKAHSTGKNSRSDRMLETAETRAFKRCVVLSGIFELFEEGD